VTETLGWGDLDVEGDAPRRRRVRVPPVLVWVIVAVVIAAFALWPTARRHLSDQAAAWLQKQWATAQAYDASRQSIERSVAPRVGVGDTERYTRIIRYLDQLEARRLTSIAHSVTGARSWSGDVRHAGETVRRALAAEAHDLVQDAAQAADAVAAPPSPPSATSLVTDALIQTAETAVADVARRHHVSKARPSKAHLTAPASLVAPLYRVTDSPLDAELAVTHGHAIDIWNLRTGTRERTIEVTG